MRNIDQSGKDRVFNLSALSGAIALATAISGAAQAAEIEEIVVTAQKRAENLQDVPIAISAFSGENIESLGVKNLTDLGKFTPGVEMNNETPLQPVYNIRGVQTFDFTVGSDPAVAVYVDGVYNARGAGAEVPLADIERVEVLKGPQGTLFGRNATGGAIHIISKKPAAEDTAELRLTTGNFGRQSSDLLLNKQLSDTLYGRLTVSNNRRDAYSRNIGDNFSAGNQDTRTYRAALLWEPTSTTEVLWRADYGVMDQGSGINVSIVPSLKGDSDIFGNFAADTPTIEDRDAFGTSLTVTSDFDAFTFTSITAYRGFDSHLQQDEDGTANPNYHFGSENLDDQSQFSQEFRFSGATDSLKWTLGASYSQEKVEHTTVAALTTGSLESFAIYEGVKANAAQAGLNLTTSELEERAAKARLAGIAGGEEGLGVARFVYGLLARSGKLDENIPLGKFGLTASKNLHQKQIIQQLLKGIQPWVQSDLPWEESVYNEGDYRSSAVYADLTWSLTDKLDLTLGGRYTRDKKNFLIQTQYKNLLPLTIGGEVDVVNVPPNSPFSGRKFPLPASTSYIPMGLAFYNNGNPKLDSSLSDSWSDFSGRIVLDYRWTEDLMTFISLADGFKAGGFNSLNFGPNIDASFDQEDIVNLEIGFKSSLLDNRVRLNASVFSYEYKNLQELDLLGKPIPSYNLRNADAEGRGGEIEVQWAATDNLLLGGNYSYLDTELTRYQIIEEIGETEADSKVGQSRVDTPKNKINLMAEYTVDLASGDNLLFRADYNWTDERIGSISDRTRIIDAYQLVNLRAGWNSSSDRYSAGLWVQNAGDEEIIGEYGGTGSSIGASPAWRYLPRTYGADFTVRF